MIGLQLILQQYNLFFCNFIIKYEFFMPLMSAKMGVEDAYLVL